MQNAPDRFITEPAKKQLQGVQSYILKPPLTMFLRNKNEWRGIVTHFNGPGYIPEIDHKRLSIQHERVKKLMSDHTWRTLGEISISTGAPEASISAQLRHLRKPRFGQFVVERRRRGEPKMGLHEYRLMPLGYESEYVISTKKSRYRRALEAVMLHPDFTIEQRLLVNEILEGDE